MTPHGLSLILEYEFGFAGIDGKGERRFMKRLLMTWCLIATLPLSAGVLYFSADWTSTGLYTLSTTTGQATLVGTSGVTGSTVGLALSDQAGQLFGSQPFGLGRINTDGSGASYVGSGGIEGLEYVAATGTLYGAINGQFFTVNQSTGAILVNLASPPGAAGPADVEGLAYGGGYIYGLAGSAGPRGDLYRYNIGADSWAFVGNAGILFDLPGLAYDPIMGWLYAIGSQDSNLYRIDPATAAATLIGPTGLGPIGGGLAYVETAIPEPGGWLLALAGLAAITVLRRRARA